MTLAAAERLLALLVASPGGAPEASVTEALGAESAGAAAELGRRSHPLRIEPGVWRLDCARQHFDPLAFATARTGAIGSTLEIWETVSSTLDLARAGAASGAPAEALWLAERQTEGRGRQGRTWSCRAHAGLLVSWVVPGPLDAAQRPALLPLVLGVGVAEGLQRVTGLVVRTKWPNDLWLDGAKLGGLLVEARPGPEGRAVVGLGLNVLSDAVSGTGVEAAATLASAGCGVRRETLLAGLLAGVEARLAEWRSGRVEAALQSWLDLDVTVGQPLRLQLGDIVVEGRGAGVTDAGLLRLVTDSGRQREFAAGEVHLL